MILKNLTLSLKTTIILGLVLSLCLLAFNVFSVIYTKNLIINKVQTQLKTRLHEIEQSIVGYDELLKDTANSLYVSFDEQFDEIMINPKRLIKVNEVETPLLASDGMALNNKFHFVDNFTSIQGATASIYARTGDDFVIISTSVRDENNKRIQGNKLDKNSKVYKTILQSKKAYSHEHWVNNDYMAVYNPIIKNDKVIGILAVGYNYTSSFANLKKRLKNVKIGESGFLYILDTKIKNQAKVLLHPRLEGKNLFNSKDENGKHFVKNMYKNTMGYENYLGKDKVEKTAFYENYDERNWKIVLGAVQKDFLKESTEFSYILGLLSFVLIVLIILFIYLIIKKLVIIPLHNLQDGLEEFFDFLNNKIENTNLIKISSNDELGVMSSLINTNIQQIKENISIDKKLIQNTLDVANKVKLGYLDSLIKTKSNNPLLNELKDVVNSMLQSIQNNIFNVQSVLSSYSSSDYTKRVLINNMQAQIKKLYEDTNTLGIVSSSMLLQNLNNGYSLKDNSITLSSLTKKLSSSSTTQAASLEETAASIEELSATMNTNKTSMNNMSNNAKTLQGSIVSGQELASKTAIAMDSINSQTQAIAQAIIVIDQIAFQTNILSLNAAVEAATAGEAGKGFAVVAQEVRNLASRSADAAKEIKALVENATAKAEEGKDISQDMIKGYVELNENVNTTTSLIEGVLLNFNEQVIGINQINDAVASLDTMTQENASIASKAEEIANITDNLAGQIVEESLSKNFDGKKS